MSYVFISYSHSDSQDVIRIRDHFEQTGFSTWIDERIDYGDRWVKVIRNKIKACGVFVVVMTPEAEESEWVETEILVARKYKKTIIGLLLKGDFFDILLGTQNFALKRENNYLPSAKFYKFLQHYVPRRPNPAIANTIRHSPVLQRNHANHTTTINLQDWVSYANPGQTDFFGLAMLSLAFEERGQHERAIFYLRKSNKLEPRVRDFHWMVENYGLTYELWLLIEQIISDPEFWKPKRLSF
ncbi:MAG: toll/interleukin-1 receptor domain-containing protein [Anaerolineae bacterium]|nr:toll/interleukin-1 receptor domain-containing protein [Anaerolineae bacterium]